jgi:hypothetical protein
LKVSYEADGDCTSSDTVTGENERIMRTDNLVVLNVILLILVLVVNMKVNAGTITHVVESKAHYCTNAWGGKQ